MKINERTWTGHLVSWIQEAINSRTTIFQDVSNDAGIKVASGRTKFPDILLFTDKNSGIVFNGWELKFPDTEIDDQELLENALEKAERLKSDSFVTWNGSETIIWKIENKIYIIDSLKKLKVYPKLKSINSREDLSDPVNYKRNETHLRQRADEILHDLEQFLENGYLKQAINVAGNITQVILKSSQIIIPQFQEAILDEKGKNSTFRMEFNKWKIYESATLTTLLFSLKISENELACELLAKFTFYNLIGKILFYLTLSENLSVDLKRIQISNLKMTQFYPKIIDVFRGERTGRNPMFVVESNKLKEAKIKNAFSPLKQRPIKIIFEEVKMPDRINFDQTILESFGVDKNTLPSYYEVLISLVNDRITMKEK